MEVILLVIQCPESIQSPEDIRHFRNSRSSIISKQNFVFEFPVAFIKCSSNNLLSGNLLHSFLTSVGCPGLQVAETESIATAAAPLNIHFALRAFSQHLLIWPKSCQCKEKSVSFHSLLAIARRRLGFCSLPPRNTRLWSPPPLIIDPGGLETENGTC